jgi:hypothetical protein
MFNHEVITAVVLGAGFPNCAGLPLQKDMPQLLLDQKFKSPLDFMITQSIKEFLTVAFGWSDGHPVPALEDIFTLIDLSAGSGHNLGRKLTPKLLRAIRRLLIDRVFALIDRKYEASPEIEAFLKRYIPLDKQITTHFVVLNWDNVLERHLHSYDNNIGVDYCVQGRYWLLDLPINPRSIGIAKVHGSSSWLYCDNCRTLFYFQYDPVSNQMRCCLRKEDFELIDEAFDGRIFSAAKGAEIFGFFPRRFDGKTYEDVLPQQQHWLQYCRLCGSIVGPHIATFSYQKSFRTHAFSSSWLAAEEILSRAVHWVFIGYSLPESDFEFKHLLKTAEQKFAHKESMRKTIDVVLKDDKGAAAKYKQFFGVNSVKVCQSGLAGFVSENNST